MKVKEKAAF